MGHWVVRSPSSKIVNREKNNGEKFTLISARNELKCRHVGCRFQRIQIVSFQIHLHIINASESELTYTDAVDKAIFTIYQHGVEL